MYCTSCGADQQPNEVNCSACGGIFNEPAFAVDIKQAPIPPIRLDTPIRRSELMGVGGWLMLFVFGITFLAMAQVTAALKSEHLFSKIVEFNFAALSIAIAILVGTANKAAIPWLRLYFASRIFLAVLLYAGGSDSGQLNRNLLLLRSALYVTVWFFYFRTSERVRLTFGRNI
jgi:hypothetical protein